MQSIELDGIEYRCFDHLYAVSRCGKVLRKGAPCEPTKRLDGYLALGRQRLMHRVVALCWIPNPRLAKHVHHINGDKSDNRAENLEWLTPKEHLTGRHMDTLGKHTVSEEVKDRLRKARLGSKTSEATKAKQRAALVGKKRPFFHRAPHTEEWKQVMSLTHHKNTECKVFGVVYRSFSEASRATGIHRFTLRKRCLSKNFPDYELVT